MQIVLTEAEHLPADGPRQGVTHLQEIISSQLSEGWLQKGSLKFLKKLQFVSKKNDQPGAATSTKLEVSIHVAKTLHFSC